MADDSKPPAAPPKTEVPPEKKPIENPQVDVRVKPATKGDRDYADKVKRNLKSDVEKTIKQNEGDGARRQLDAAKKTVKEAGKQVDPAKVKEISVNVDGKVGKTNVGDETIVKPGPPPAPAPEGPPPSPAPAPKKDDGKTKK